MDKLKTYAAPLLALLLILAWFVFVRPALHDSATQAQDEQAAQTGDDPAAPAESKDPASAGD